MERLSYQAMVVERRRRLPTVADFKIACRFLYWITTSQI